MARLKILAQLEIAERREPQDGKICVPVGDREVELRVATVPTAGGNEDMVLRILARNATFRLEHLGMTARNLAELRTIVSRPHGLILCVGPTGSGKTTTLHALIDFINRPTRKIRTAEDPVEITQEGLRQVQVEAKIGFTFAAAMRAFLRADPDIIMVGELRDQETAAIVTEASLTGHLVLSTPHTNSAPETVARLLDMGVDPFTCADAMLGIIAQRLVKCICVTCKESHHPPRSVYDDLADADVGPSPLRRAVRALARPGLRRLQRHRVPGARRDPRAFDRLRRGPAVDPVPRSGRGDSRPRKGRGLDDARADGIGKLLHGITDIVQVRAVAIR